MMQAQQRFTDLIGFTIPVRLPIIAALIILVLGLSIAYSCEPAQRDSITFLALALTAAGTIGGTFYLGAALRAQLAAPIEQAEQQKKSEEASLKQKKITEAFALIARWNSPDLHAARKASFKALQKFQEPSNTGGGEKGVRQLLDTDEEIAHNARHVLNFLEELALAIRFEQCDEQVLVEAFAGLVKRSYKAYKSWIEENRTTTGREKMWIELEKLSQKWAQR